MMVVPHFCWHTPKFDNALSSGAQHLARTYCYVEVI